MKRGRTRKRRRRWLVGTIVGAMGLAGAAIWASMAPRFEVWPDIQTSIQQERWSEAEARLRRWVARDPDDVNAWMTLADVLVTRGDDSHARDALQHVPAADPAWPRAQAKIGEIALREHNASLAERALRSAVNKDAKAIEPRRRLASLFLLELRTDDAREVLRELYALTHDPHDLVALVGLTLPDWNTRDLSPELRKFNPTEKPVDDPWLQRAEGLNALRLGRALEAHPKLLDAVERIDGDPAGRIALAECRLLLGAETGVEDDLGPEPSQPDLRAKWWLMRGQIARVQGDANQTLECLAAAVAADPQNRAAQYQLGQALTRLGGGSAYEKHFQQASAIRERENALKAALDEQLDGGHSAESFERIGKLCQESGLLVEARGWFAHALELDPTRTALEPLIAKLPASFEPAPSTLHRRSSRVRTSADNLPKPPELATLCFEDYGVSSGISFQYNPGKSDSHFLAETMGGGVGLIDYDGDGWLDIYVVNGCELPCSSTHPPTPNKLFRNLHNGAFTDVTVQAGVAGRGFGMGCAVADYDNDGRDDLFVTGLGQTLLYHNQGNGKFEEVTEKAGVGVSDWTTACGWGDLDGDGDLDLVVISFVDADPRHVPSCRDTAGEPIHCLASRYRGQKSHMFRNNSNGTFTDVSERSGFQVPGGAGLGLAIADLDDDGKLDIFVANDGTPNFLFHNLGGMKFEEVGMAAGVACDGAGRANASKGVVADDLDGDGLIDLFHVNAAGEPSTLLHNRGKGQFLDTTITAGLDAPSRSSTGFGALTLDADNNGALDVFVANGHLSDQRAIGLPMEQESQLFQGDGKGKYWLAAKSSGDFFTNTSVARGAAAGDLNNDGKVDLVVVNRNTTMAVLFNVMPSGQWLGIRLRGKTSGATPVGARVICKVGEKSLVRWVTSGTGYLSSSDQRLWFGLGSRDRIDHLEVRWPTGSTQTWSNLQAGRILEITEGRDPVELPTNHGG